MKCYYVNELKNKEQYEEFISYMLSYSEYFSFIYFRYSENERMRKSTRMIHDALKKFKVKSQFTHEWPGTFSLDQSHYYKFILYRSDLEAKEILNYYSKLFDWDYPQAPMDLCFYKDDYCYFSVTAHEHDACLYTNDAQLLSDLRKIGLELQYFEDTENIFRLDKI